MASTATLTALTRAGENNNSLQLNRESDCTSGSNTKMQSWAREHTPFFSCRHREDRPRPLTGCFTSSPIQDVSALCTEPANETLRTADSDSKELLFTVEIKKYKFNRSKINHQRQNTITKTLVLLLRAIKQCRSIR